MPFAGKTTLLRYLLETSRLKIGCIVNDVASVNIDAKLIRNDRSREKSNGINTTSDLADTIELANGCACELTYYMNIYSPMQQDAHGSATPCLREGSWYTSWLQAVASRTNYSPPLSSCWPWQMRREPPMTGPNPAALQFQHLSLTAYCIMLNARLMRLT